MSKCDTCLKDVPTNKVNVSFDGRPPFYINLCAQCKNISQTYFIVICEECGNLEFWHKGWYAPRLKIPFDSKINVLITQACLNCYAENKFYRG